MKNAIIIVLFLLAIYWLFDHFASMPLSHESMGLYNHTAHRIIGLVFLGIGAFLTWKWKFKR